ncbi:MAG: ribonuclease G [Saezia sp.]
MHEIMINTSPQETRVVSVEAGEVQELYIERQLERGLVGNIYLGRVARVLPGMQSAFIDIGQEKAAFLHAADVWQPHVSDHEASSETLTPIEKLVFQGQPILVQVVKDAIGNKGARLTTQISIAGRMLVLLPQDDHIGVSTRIEGEEHREALRLRLSEIVASLPGEGHGFILRTNAEDATNAELVDDVSYLRRLWASISERAKKSSAPSMIYEDLNLLQRVLRDLLTEDTKAIRIDSKEEFKMMMEFGKQYMPSAVDRLKLFEGDRHIFDYYSIEEELAKALQGRVGLKSGGYLIFDQTEALTTIDVNTGGYVGARNFDETIFKTNLEAAGAIARQLRLRNLGGIIIIDFIDMENLEHRTQVLEELNKKLTKDRVKTVVSDFSALGLVEMTRKRTRESLSRMMCEPCPICEGRGEVKTVRTVCYEILREVLREAKQFNPKEFCVIACPKVVEAFLDEESQHLAELSEHIGKRLSLQAESAMTQEDYDIVLL